MLDEILNLKNAHKLNKDEQKQVLGGKAPRCCIDWDPIARRCYQYDQGCLGN